MQLRKSRFFLFARGSQLDNVVTSPCIVEMARNMFHAQNLHKSSWMEAVANAVYTWNQYALKVLDSNMS